jgi:hypothetical protein
MSLARPDPKLAKELEIILDDFVTGGLAANAQHTSLPVSTPTTPGNTNGSLGPGQYVELLAEEYWPPFDQGGFMEDLRIRYLILDSAADTRSWFYESGRADLNTTPAATQNAEGHRLTYLGGGVLEAVAILVAGPQPGEDDIDVMTRAIAALAVPRANASVVQVCQAGPTAVTGNFQSRYWGHRFTEPEIDALAAMMPNGGYFGGTIRLKRPWFRNGAGLSVLVQIPLVKLSAETWTKLPGGMAQDTPGVFPFRRWAINAQPTSGAAKEYAFSWTGAAGSNVSSTDQYQNLNFNFAQGTAQQGALNNMLVVEGFQVRPLVQSADTNKTDLTITANIPPTASQYIRCVGDQPSEIHPNNGLPCTITDNPQLAGWTYPTYGAGTQLYRNLRRPAGTGFVAMLAQAYVAFRDAGAVVAANTAGAQVEGLLVQGFKTSQIEIE